MKQKPVGYADLQMPVDRGAWHDVPDATKWVDELRGGETPKREWVGLTNDEIQKMAPDFEEGYVFLYKSFAAAIETKLKEKNSD